SIDKFHKKEPRLYQVMEHQQYADNLMTTSSTPGILAETLKEEIPEIEYAATTTWIGDNTLSVEDLNIKAKGYHVGADYFNIFSYPLIQGQPDQVLADKKSIVISAELALKLFNTTEDVLGRDIEYQHKKVFQVSGIFAGTPRHSSYQFDFVLPFEDFKDENEWVTSWGSNGPLTYVILQNNSDPEQVRAKIADFVRNKNEQSNVTLFLQQYSDRYLHGRYNNGQPAGGRIEYVRLFSIIALFILIIACINFMNLSTARASTRAKEVGIRKSVGAPKSSLILQYLIESLLVTFFALFLALALVWLFLPEFNQITNKQIILEINGTSTFYIFSIALVTGIVAGSYPSFYLSGFHPLAVLKGNLKGSLGELWARRGLVVFQFFLSIILIVSVTVVYQQIRFVQSHNPGYDKGNIIYFPMEGALEKKLDTFLKEVKNIPGVKNASSIAHRLTGQQISTSGLVWEGKDPNELILFENVRVNHDMLETMGVKLKEGRLFSRDIAADTGRIIFNEAAIKVMNIADPIGKTIKLWEEYDMEIIGVVRDFHFQSLHESIRPLFFLLTPNNTWNVMVKTEQGRESETISALEALYKTFNPGFSFDYKFLDQSFAELYAAEQRVATLSQYFAGFAILISCLGLFGLAAFTAERRIKEIGIRKAMGSTMTGIVFLLTKDFTRLVITAIALALPFSYWLNSYWLERFAFRISLEWWFFAGAGLVAIIIAWLTTGFHAFRAARSNPAHCLRDE
ncbi:MAG: ABC transporter permease, partial [Cyclobacteriaceae bacterium]|nr:ABC transporter permease [Cyclobacteriaceae bacterium]